MSTAELDWKRPRARGGGPTALDLGFYVYAGIGDFRLERARATKFRHSFHTSGGCAARCPEGHIAVVYGADQRREMRAAHNPAGCAVGVPVAFKSYRVGGGGLRAGRFRLRAEDDGGKEEKTHCAPAGTAEDAGEAQKADAPARTDIAPAGRNGRTRQSV